MNRALLVAPCLLGGFVHDALARGVSPYLPLNLEPEIERRIEQVLVLGDKAGTTRPIAAATVLDALPKACAIDRLLCEQVRRYLARYTQTSQITHASLEGGGATDSTHVVPNRYGLRSSSAWNASAEAFWQPSDYMLINVGGIAYDGDADPVGSMVSIGFDWAQLDLGFRPHWFSPFTDSSMLIGTEAQTMPSATLSNYRPLTRLGFQYEVFLAKMAYTEHIAYKNRYTAGNPRFAGVHLAIEPISGWTLAFNRILQYGGGERGGNSIHDFLDAFFKPSQYDNADDQLGFDQQFGNQAASFTSRFIYPGRVPFSVYFEYAGEDTSRGKNYLLGNASLSMGVHFPKLFKRFDLTYETSEWQNNWYVHGIYQDGLTNKGLVIGHWGADQRLFNNDVGSRTQMLDIGWQMDWGGLLELRYRSVENAKYATYPYERGRDVTLRLSMPIKEFTVGAEGNKGKDVFGDDFSQFGVFVRYAPQTGGMLAAVDDEPISATQIQGAELFVDLGANLNQVQADLSGDVPRSKTDQQSGLHLALGARRALSERQDLGVRIEYDDVDGHPLIGARALDYRYRFGSHLALGGFLGAARYELATPAYGMYAGMGVQWRNLLPGWDIGADVKYATKVARDHVLPSDPQSTRPDSFYDIYSTSLYLTKRF